MANPLDQLERFELLVAGLATEIDDLERNVDSAARCFPNFAESASAEKFDQSVAGNRFVARFESACHGTAHDRSKESLMRPSAATRLSCCNTGCYNLADLPNKT